MELESKIASSAPRKAIFPHLSLEHREALARRSEELRLLEPMYPYKGLQTVVLGQKIMSVDDRSFTFSAVYELVSGPERWEPKWKQETWFHDPTAMTDIAAGDILFVTDRERRSDAYLAYSDDEEGDPREEFRKIVDHHRAMGTECPTWDQFYQSRREAIDDHMAGRPREKGVYEKRLQVKVKTKNGSLVHRFASGVKPRDVMRALTTSYFGKNGTTRLQYLVIGHAGTLRLPENVKFHVEQLDLQNDACLMLPLLTPILDVNCIPLRKLSYYCQELPLNVSRSPLFVGAEEIHVDSLETSPEFRRRGEIRQQEIEALFELENPLISLDYQRSPPNVIVSLVEKWLRDGTGPTEFILTTDSEQFYPRVEKKLIKKYGAVRRTLGRPREGDVAIKLTNNTDLYVYAIRKAPGVVDKREWFVAVTTVDRDRPEPPAKAKNAKNAKKGGKKRR